MKTRADVIVGVLQNLGIFAPGQEVRTAAASTVTLATLIKQVLQNLGIYVAGQGPRTAAASTKTRTDLKNYILQELQSYGVAQSPSADDVAEVEFRLDGVLDELKTRGIYSGGITTTFPNDIFLPLGSAAAALMVAAWGVTKINGLDIGTYLAGAEQRLLKAELTRGSASTMVTERINGAIEELKTRGIYLGGVTANFPDDIYVPLAAAISPMLAAPLGIEKIDGMPLHDYRLQAEDRLYKSDLARGRGYNMVNDRLDGVIAELSSLNIYGGVSDDEFEDEVYPSLTEAVAALMAVPFRINQIAGMDVETYRLRAEGRLRRIFNTGSRGYVQRAEYY